MRHEVPAVHLQERGVDEESSSRQEAAAQPVRSADQHREGGDHAAGEGRQASGAASSEGSSSGLQRHEASGLPEPEHSGGDDSGDEEAEGGDGGSGEGAGREQPLLREVWDSDTGRRSQRLKTRCYLYIFILFSVNNVDMKLFYRILLPERLKCFS